MSDEPKHTGPSEATLNFLRANLPDFVKGLAKKTLVGKGKPVKNDRPRKWCEACGVAFEFGSNVEGTPIKKDICPECQAKLDKGDVCITDGRRYAFAKVTEKLASAKGTIMVVDAYVMDAVEEKFETKDRPFMEGPQVQDPPDVQSGAA